MTKDPDCLFCKIAAGEIPCFKVYEDEQTLAFMDINPAHEGHTLAIPKSHFADVTAISPEAVAATAQTAAKVARAVTRELAPPGLNLLQCNGPAAAQSVMHFHMHILPRKTDDGLALNWGLVPGDMAAIEALAKRLAGAIEGS